MRLATFNVKHGAPADSYRGNPEVMAAACADLKADVLALQEVDRGVIRSKRADLASMAGEAAGMKVVFEKTMLFRGGLYGNALLVRGEIDEDYEVLHLKGGRRFRVCPEPRNAIVATVYIGERRISVAATHLSTEKRISRKQLPQIIAKLAHLPKPQVLLGDLNMVESEVLPYTSAEGLVLAEGDPTIPVQNPRRRIDHIAVNGLNILSSEVMHLPISDHLAQITVVD